MQKEKIANDEVYTVEDLAQLLQLSSWTVRGLVKSGKIPHIKIGNRYRFCGWQIKEWLNQGAKNRKTKKSI